MKSIVNFNTQFNIVIKLLFYQHRCLGLRCNQRYKTTQKCEYKKRPPEKRNHVGKRTSRFIIENLCCRISGLFSQIWLKLFASRNEPLRVSQTTETPFPVKPRSHPFARKGNRSTSAFSCIYLYGF